MNSYDEIPYKSSAFIQSNPNQLASCARILGLDTPEPSGARVLEIGSSFGGNLIPFALANPNSFCHGVDLSKAQIQKGTEIAALMGVKNLVLEQMDITKFNEKYGGGERPHKNSSKEYP